MRGYMLRSAAVALCLLGTAGAARAAEIKWSRSLPSALAEAKSAKKLVMVDFYTDW